MTDEALAEFKQDVIDAIHEDNQDIELTGGYNEAYV